MDLDDEELKATRMLNGAYGNVKCMECEKLHNCDLTPEENCNDFMKKLNINKKEFTDWIEERNENINV